MPHPTQRRKKTPLLAVARVELEPPPQPKPIQENFGEAILEAVHRFCDTDLESVHEFETQHFSHVDEATLRTSLAETMYGARWIYKLGLALLVKDTKQLAHVRFQLLDYGAVCEGLLSAMILHGIVGNHLKGKKYGFTNTARLSDPIDWTLLPVSDQLAKRSFHWLIDVAADESIVDAELAKHLHDMRKQRNTIHLRARTYRAYLGTSKHLYGVFRETVSQTKTWKVKHK